MPQVNASKAAPNKEQHYDPVAQHVHNSYRSAALFRSTDKVGNVAVNEVLKRSYRQYHSIYDPCDRELVEESGVDVFPSITKLKVDIIQAFARDMFVSAKEDLITIKPTPVPTLSPDGRNQAISKLRAKLVEQPFSDPIELATFIKQQQMVEEIDIARRESSRQQKIINDQLTEVKFINQLMDYIYYFTRDPFAVMVAPIKRGETVLAYSGNKLVDRDRINEFVSVPDPRDYYYSSDAGDNGTGAFEIIKEKMSRNDLYRVVNANGWVNKNVKECIENFENMESYDWLESNHAPEDKSTMIPWGENDSINVLRYFGKMSGKELRPFGFSLDPDKFYEIMALTCGRYTLKIEANVDPVSQRRRVYTSSYQSRPGNKAGFGMGQIIRDIERMYLSSIRALMQNVGFSSMPMGEVDFKRIQRYITSDQIGSLFSGTLMPVDPDMSGGGRPAAYLHNVPNHANSITSLLEYFTRMADRHSGIPAVMSGEAIGSGINRTFRGAATLQSNAMKQVQSAFINLDQDVIEPVGQAYHWINKEKHKFKGDSQIQVLGLGGLLSQEVKRQTSMETLQLITQIAASAPQTLPGETLEWAVAESLKASGVPDSIVDAPKPEPEMSQLPPDLVQ